MCGIVGLISRKTSGFNYPDVDMFQAMLVNDSQRGEDSTGAFTVFRQGDVSAVKVASNPFNLFACKAWDDFKRESFSKGTILVGHNRKATQGGIISANAHPFAEGEIILVHNGTLKNHNELDTGKEVDSHAICHAFNTHGYENVIPTLDGAFALVWYNLRTHKLHMVRNKERPLCLVEQDELFAFASEAWMAHGQFMRRGMKVNDSYLLDEGHVYTFDLHNLTKGEYVKEKIELYKPKTYYPVATQSSNHSFYKDAEDDLTQMQIETARARSSSVKSLFETGIYKAQDILQGKISRIAIDNNWETKQDQPKAYGKIININTKQETDFTAWLDADVKPAQYKDWQEGFIIGEVAWVTTTNCGPSVHLRNVALDDTLVCYEGEVGKLMWSDQISGDQGCKCSKCNSVIQYEDSRFTSVNLKKNTCRIHCHKCVEESLKFGEQRNAFIERRNAAVQARKPISESSRYKPVSTVQQQSTPTVH